MTSLRSQHLYSSANYSDESPAAPVQHELRIVNTTESSDSDASSPTLCRAELAPSIMEEDVEEYHLLSTLPKETRRTWTKLMIADICQRLERLENILRTYNAVLDPSCDSPCSTMASTSDTFASSIRDDYEDDAEELAACLEALKDMTKRVHHSREQSKKALEERKKEREAILSRCL
ncbi:uncharacterized protein LAESUDRAFT_728308 [Laetiporus sulphureus 93-53]|uniref:Uncharacterized protein n=1 Tax=Laetiporus sulphureus 93-53 TaxID=1314785 RepID=A0A165DA47_9APHY|nr:uncharacterized protein LAESUDRAFT_728308 [Laetiporus sulphureus 93-53]KZT04421.1 hypothetical protein LAESUDRAFT_728308 [Laetiporus sulphureus 93-53]